MNTPARNSKQQALLWFVWLIEGIIVGFGAILPGISGGTLCVAFGMYRPIIESVSDIKQGIKKDWLMLGFFAIGIGVGFIGLSGLASYLLDKNTALVTCAFIGFILGTLPELWSDAGTSGRNKSSYFSMITAFTVMIAVLFLLRTKLSITVSPDIAGFVLCGVLWGLSFIVPGLSSSSLLLFFGLYKPMLDGISSFDMSVLIPMFAGMAACVLLLAKIVGFAYKKYYSIVSHGVLGIVAATAVMIFPAWDGELSTLVANVTLIVCGAFTSFYFTRICGKLKTKAVN